MSSLEYREPSDGDFRPMYAEVDWLQLRLGKLAMEGLQPQECWIVIDSEEPPYEQQITQENTYIEYNYTNPDADRIAVVDNRDGDAWVWFRGEQGDEKFEFIAETLGAYALRMASLYPREVVANMYAQRQLKRLDSDLEAGLEGLVDGTDTTG